MIKQNNQYGTQPAQVLDLYTPNQWHGKSLILIHGGGWWQGDKSKEVNTAKRFMALGYCVATINYRLALNGQNSFPTQNQDIEAAYQWLLRTIPEFSPQNTAFIGGSTGGNLATYMGLTTGRPFVSLSGLLDLAGFYATHLDITPVQRTFSAKTASSAIDQDGSDDPYYKWIIENLLPKHDQATLATATVFNQVSQSSGPGLLINSMNEIVPAYEHQHIARLLRLKSVPVETILLPGHRHGEAYLDDVFDSIINFLNRYMTIKN